MQQEILCAVLLRVNLIEIQRLPDMRLRMTLLHFFLTCLFFWHRLNIHFRTENLNIITVSGGTPLIIGRLQAPEPP